MTKQALGECPVEPLYDSLVSVNFRVPAANSGFVVFHFFGHASHELAPRVGLQQLRPRQSAALVNRLKSFRNLCRVFGGQRLSLFVTAGDVDNNQHVFVNFVAHRDLLIRQKKKARLVDRVRLRYVEFGLWNIPRRGEIDLPKGLFDEPLLGGFFRDFCSVC